MMICFAECTNASNSSAQISISDEEFDPYNSKWEYVFHFRGHSYSLFSIYDSCVNCNHWWQNSTPATRKAQRQKKDGLQSI